MRTVLLSLLITVGLAACGTSRVIPNADADILRDLKRFEDKIGPPSVGDLAVNEPGQRLMILGRLRTQEPHCGSDVTIHVYQADQEGRYRESVPGQEETARLQSTLRTDREGRFLLRTILPGDYGSTDDNRHIHLTIEGAKEGAKPAAYDFYFGQFLNRGLRRWAERTDQAIILDLTRDPAGRLVARGEVVVRGFSDSAECRSPP